MRKIEDLDLELSECAYQSKKVTLDRYNIDCNIKGNLDTIYIQKIHS